MGGPKALLVWEDAPLLLAVLARYAGEDIGPRIAVVSPAVRDAIEPALDARRGVRLVENPAPHAAMMTSVRLGLREALALGVARVFVQPVDAGPPSQEVLQALLLGLGKALAAKPVVVDRGGHPVLLTVAACERILAGQAATLRDALAELGPGSLVRVPVEDPSVLANWNDASGFASRAGSGSSGAAPDLPRSGGGPTGSGSGPTGTRRGPTGTS